MTEEEAAARALPRRRARPPKATRATGLAGLAGLRQALEAQRREEALRAAKRRAEQAAAQRERRLFVDSVGPVTPLPPVDRADTGATKPAPLPRQREADERAALLEAWSDAVDVESLLLTDDGLSFRRPGIGPDVVTRLRRGEWTLQGELDLHGLTRDEARAALQAFLAQAARQGKRCVRVVHGKGHGSPGRQPVLKAKVQRWLAQAAEVIAFSQAAGPDGGAGALIVLLAG